ncbi:hypothetical protein [Streptomyces turgidiscabies]|uniref:hypothetical protein n=1 Tax=Streptomyces turgidiscabies TaxID=85558 RepID=UPI0038F77C8E
MPDYVVNHPKFRAWKKITEEIGQDPAQYFRAFCRLVDIPVPETTDSEMTAAA